MLKNRENYPRECCSYERKRISANKPAFEQLSRLAAARGLGLLLYGSNMAGGRYAYPYGPSPTDESLKLRVLNDEKHSIVFD